MDLFPGGLSFIEVVRNKNPPSHPQPYTQNICNCCCRRGRCLMIWNSLDDSRILLQNFEGWGQVVLM